MSRAREERLGAALLAAGLGVWEWNLETGALIGGEHLASFAFDPERGAPSAWNDLIHPDELEAELALLRQLVCTGEARERAWRMAGRARRWVRIQGRVVERAADGAPTRAVGTLEDVTARNRKERELAALYAVTRALVEAETAGAGIRAALGCICRDLGWDVGAMWLREPGEGDVACGELLPATGAAFSRFREASLAMSFAPGIGLPGRVIATRDAAWIVDLARDENFLRAAIAALDGLTSGFAFPILMDGVAVGVLEFFSTEPRERDDGALENLSMLGAQIGQFIRRKQSDEALRAAKDAAEAANREKSRFTATLSHEIRTPLNAVLGMAALLLDTRLDDAQRRYAEGIRDAGQVLRRVVGDTLDLSKIEAGRLEFKTVDFDLRATVAAVRSFFLLETVRKGISLRVSVGADVPAVVRGDPVRVEQVLLNLVGNAVKFTERGGIDVSLDLAEAHADAVVLRCKVRDTGPGIRADQHRRIFEPFFRLDGSNHREGTGLGLAISAELVRRMNGSLDVESEVGVGSCFAFTMSLRRSETNEVPGAEGGGHRTFAGGIGRRRLSKVEQALVALVAEDSPANASVMMALLERLGIACDVVGTGRDAVDAVRRTGYRVIFMDCQMPLMDGFDAAREIRAWETVTGIVRRTPIVAVTANALRGDRERCLAAGMDDYVPKPIDLGALRDVLARWVTAPARNGGRIGPETHPRAQRSRAVAAGRAAGVHLDPRVLADLSSTLDREGKPMLARVTSGVLRDAPTALDAARASITLGDLASGARAAHSLKGIVLVVGARDVAMVAESFGDACRRGDGETAAMLLDDLSRNWSMLARALRRGSGRRTSRKD